MTSTQPPGWYPDATLPGHERWWDGTAWSPVTRLAPDLAASGYGVADSAPHGDSQSSGGASVAGSDRYGAPSGQDSAWGAQAPSESFEQYQQPQPSQAAVDPWGAPAQSASWDAPAPPAAPSAPSAPDYASPPYASPHPAPGDYGGSPYVTPSSGGQPSAPEYGSQPGGSSYPPPPAGSAPYPGYGQPPAAGGYQQYPSYPSGPYGANPYGEYAAAHNLAGPGTRLLARIIDWLIVGIVSAIIGLPFYRQVVQAYGDLIDAATAGATSPDTSALTSAAIKAGFVSLLVGALYEVVLIALRGATVGKMALGLKVQSQNGVAGTPGWGAALIRWAVRVIPFQVINVLWAIDSLWCLWDGRRQCLHDKAARTIVVRSR